MYLHGDMRSAHKILGNPKKNITQNIGRSLEENVNDKWGRIWKETVMA
jgi:hypothetical protein